MVGGRKEIDPETRRVFNRLMAQAASLWFGNVVDRVRGREEEGVMERHWETMLPGETDDEEQDETKNLS